MSAPDTPESAEDFYARVLAATGQERRLAVAVEEMPGWDIFPFEIDSLRIKPLQPARGRGAGRAPARTRRTCCLRLGPRPARRRAVGLEQRALG